MRERTPFCSQLTMWQCRGQEFFIFRLQMLQWNLPSLISLQAEGPLSDTSILAVTKALEVKHLSLSVKSPFALISWPCFMHEFLLMQCKCKEVRDLFWKKNFFVECCCKWNSLPFLQHAKARVSESWWWADKTNSAMEWKRNTCREKPHIAAWNFSGQEHVMLQTIPS